MRSADVESDGAAPSSHRKRHASQTALALIALLLTALPLRPIGAWEASLFYAVNGLPGWLFPVVWLVMQAGSLFTVTAVAVVSFVTRRVRQGVDVAAAGLAAWFLARVVKEIVGRARPGEILEDVIVRSPPLNGQGYVSGHAAVAAALAAALSPYLSRTWRIVLWVTAGLVALGRIYVGAHLPLDVLGGMAMGWAIGSVVHVLLGHPGRHSDLESARSSR
jgi:glycosyltransferase 2 family protein